MAVRVPGVPAGGGVVRGARPRRPALARGRRRRRGRRAGRADPRRRAALQPHRGQPGRLPDARPGRAARCDAADPAVPSRTPPATERRDRTTARTIPVWSRDPTRRAIRALRRPPAGGRRTSTGSSTPAAAPASSKNQQRWAFIVCHDRERLQARSRRSVRGPATSRARRSDRPGDAGPVSAGRAAVDPVRPRPGGGEHDAGGVGARHRQRPGDGLRARDRPRDPGLPARTGAASTSCRSGTRPTRPTSRGGRRRAAGRRSTSSSTRSAGRGRAQSRGARPGYCQRNLRDAIPKQTTSHPPMPRHPWHRASRDPTSNQGVR